MSRIILPRNIEVVFASFGGVGTTFLMAYLAQYKKINNPYDQDDFKHSPLPPISFSRNLKFVYIYGNPILASISLFRRNFHHFQSLKLQTWNTQSWSPIPPEMTLEEYASAGVDQFHFSNHFYNWYDKYLTHPTLFLRYESIFDNVEPLLEFLELPQSCQENFPKKKKRNSQKMNLPEEILAQLQGIYGDFNEELMKLNDWEIRMPTQTQGMIQTYLKPAYLRALAQQAYEEPKTIIKQNNPQLYQTLSKFKSSLIK